MKFAKQLQNDRTQEWLHYYLDYKFGKKVIKRYADARSRGAPVETRVVDDFFKKELTKVESFYAEQEALALERIKKLKMQCNVYEEQRLYGQSFAENGWAGRDYEPPPTYRRNARKMLKKALIEFYRTMELLQAYIDLNVVAFRKLNKKYDKATGTHTPLKFFQNQVRPARFVTGSLVEDLSTETVDLFAKHYEFNDRRAARDELRAKITPDYKMLLRTMFNNGSFLALGGSLAFIGIVDAFTDVAKNPNLTHTSFLLQLYAGYFLMLLLTIFFGLACRTFEYNKISYEFIFQLDTNSSLHWREILELPLFFFALLGISVWATFSYDLHDFSTRRWFPLGLVVTTVAVVLFPAPVLYHDSRRWFLRHLARLIPSGLLPVRFADFFIGDLFCSLSYSMSNIYVFFCVYGKGWQGTETCTSSHSSFMGFLTALPAIWRALQCLRRAYDDWSYLPHLPNFGKYLATCLTYALLSRYRIEHTLSTEIAYIIFASINTIYTMLWDVYIDWSLGDPHAKGLRDILVFRKKKWVYYIAIVWDVVIRCNWVTYIAVKRYPQHSSLASFIVALTEVMRRGAWIVFRVENAHLGNVREGHAYRTPPLPYNIEGENQASASATDMNGTNGAEGAGEGEGPQTRKRLTRNKPSIREVHMLDSTRAPERADSDDSSDDDHYPTPRTEEESAK